ncbi:hypothetical protein U1Q18_019857 [Sarracenia purpurea var. burkii]
MVALISFQALQFPSSVNHFRVQRRWRSGHSSHHSVTVRSGLIAEASGEPAPMGQKTKYNDGLFAKAFMTLFAWKMEKFAAADHSSKTGGGAKVQKKKKKKGWFEYDYESFVEVSKRVMQGRSRLQQQQVVREVLLSMLPPGAPAQFRRLFPPTKWAAEFNAALTVPFFHWLVGPSEVVEVEVDGVKQRSGVHIKKCR